MRLMDKFVNIALTPRSIRLPNQLFIIYKKDIGAILYDLRSIKPDVIYTLPRARCNFNDRSNSYGSKANESMIF